MAALAGYTTAFFNVTPEMAKLFNQALSEMWEPARLQSAIRNTAWYKSTSQTEREAWLLKSSDPAEHQRRVDEMVNRVRSLAGQIGITLGVPTLGKLASQAFLNGWNDDQIRSQLGMATFNANKKGAPIGGLLADARTNIRQAMANYGVTVTKNSESAWLSGIAQGLWDEKYAIEEIKRLAKSTYPGLAEQIDAGQTVMQVASPYIESMAEILELNPQDVTLKDPHLRQALSLKDKDGKWTTRSVGDFEVQLRKDPRWVKTKNAQDSIFSAGLGLLQKMGLKV
jgi:hypothetical protein